MRGKIERLIGCGISKLRVCGLACARVGEREADLPGLFRRRLIRHFHREFQLVAFAQKARRIRLHHDVLCCHQLVFEIAAAQIPIVGKAHEAPCRQRFRHRELHRHRAILACE